VPYMLILGAREVENGAVAVRARERGDLGAKPVDEVIRLLCEEVSTRSLTPKV